MQKLINIFDNLKNFIDPKNIDLDLTSFNEDIFNLYFDIKECAENQNDELAHILLKLLDNQQFEKIEKTFIDYLKITSLTDEVLAEYYFKFARYQCLTLEFENGLRFFRLAYEKSLKQNQTKQNFKFIDALLKILIQLNELDEADQFFKNYVDTNKIDFNSGFGREKFEFIDNIIFLYLNKKEYQKANEIIKQIENVYLKNNLKNTIHFANLQRLKAEILLEKKDYNKANEIFLNILNLIKNLEDNIDLQNLIYNHLIFIAEQNLDFTTCLDYIDTQINLIVENLDRDLCVNDLLHILLKQSQIYEKIDNIEQAIYSLKEALNLIEDYKDSPEEFDSNIEEISIYLYHNIAELYLKINKVEKALKNFKKSIEFVKKTNIKFDFSLIYANIGLCYFKMKNHEKSLEYYKKVQKLDSNNIAALIQSAEILSLMKNTKDSIKQLEKGLKILENSDNLDDNKKEQKITIMGMLAILYTQTEKYNLAIPLFETVLHYYKKIGLKNTLDIAFLYQGLGISYIETKNDFEGEGLKKLFKALEIMNINKLNKDDQYIEVIANVYTHIGAAYYQANIFDLSLANYKIALDFLKKNEPVLKESIKELKKIILNLELEQENKIQQNEKTEILKH